MEFLLGGEFDRMGEREQEGVLKGFEFVELTKSESCFGEFVCYFTDRIRSYIRGAI